MGKVEPHLGERHPPQSRLPDAQLVGGPHSLFAHGWEEFAVRQRQVGDRQAGAVVAHERAGEQLNVDHDKGDCREEGKPLPGGCGRLAVYICVVPPARRHDREQGGQAEKSLCEAGVDYRQVQLDQDDAQPADDALDDHRAKDSRAEPADPAPRLRLPRNRGEEDR